MQQKTFLIEPSQSYFCINKKVWYHQILIQNYFGCIVSDLMKVLIQHCLEKDNKKIVKIVKRQQKKSEIITSSYIT